MKNAQWKVGVVVVVSVCVTACFDGSGGDGTGGGSGGGGGGGGSGASPGALTQVNQSAAGASGNAGVLANVALSPDGTKVAFWSRATNLVAGVADGNTHLYLKVLATGEVSVLDTTKTGELANDGSTSSAARALTWRPDGTEIAFSSSATNLVPSLDLASVGYAPYLYAKNLADNSIGFVALGADEAAWSPDGTKIAFVSRYEYGPGANSDVDVYVWTIGAPNGPSGHPFVQVSTNAAGALPTSPPSASYRPVWSPDSARIAFTSYSRELVPGDTNAVTDVFVKTLGTGAIERVSVSESGAQADHQSDWAAWSPDGTRLAFSSEASNLVGTDGNASSDIFVKELASGKVTLVSVAQDGTAALLPHRAPRWSPDGKRISFVSESVQLVSQPLDTNQREDVYVKTLATGEIVLVSITAEGQLGNGGSTTLSTGGNTGGWLPGSDGLLFVSRSTNFSPADANSAEEDLFLKKL